MRESERKCERKERESEKENGITEKLRAGERLRETE